MCNVSIIVPNYNHSKFLRERLDSIFNQTYQDFEVILLDDCSTDNSVEILKEYANHPKVSHFEVNDQNSGSPFKQWQKGIALAKGDWIWIAESDDYSSEFFLEKITQNCGDVDAKDVGLIYCQSIDVDEQSVEKFDREQYTKEFVPNIWEQNFIFDGKEFITNYLMHKNVIPNASAVVFKKSILCNFLEDDGILKMKMAGDWLFWIQLLEKSNIFFIAQKLNKFRESSGATRNHNSIQKKYQRICEEIVILNYLFLNKRVSEQQYEARLAAFFSDRLRYLRVLNFFSLRWVNIIKMCKTHTGKIIFLKVAATVLFNRLLKR